MSRRGVLAGSLGGVGAAFLGGCADDGLPGAADEPPPDDATPIPGSDVLTPRRVTYGDDPAQYADLYRPAPGTSVDGRASKGVVVVIHGGFWRAEYDATLGAPLALSLAENGWTAWNLEYRRVGSGEGGGGGFPTTLDDVAAGIDALADVDELTDEERATVLTLGHSAGGHLAVWAAARGRFERWAPERVPVTGAVSQAGVLDLTGAADDATARPHVLALVGGDAASAPDAYAQADPTLHLPLGVPVRCVHGTDDQVVPITQSLRYVERAVAAGDDATLTEVDGDHFVVIDEASPAWFTTLDLLEGLRRPAG
ncbi:alpha/beta hydrolase family protein [Nocardioides sp. CPCC 205120]|uniref:alpha/beta hydrolase family protein n=1 Tax=Nocardioides sp. CPCC 205120 TaxID=3406462 RepID=UPI003B4FFB07